MSLLGHGRLFGTTHAYFSTASGSGPSTGATVGLLSARREPLAGLLGHFIGAGKDAGRDRQPEYLRGLEIDHQFEFAWLLNGKIGGLRPFQDPVNVVGGTPVKVRTNYVISYQATGTGAELNDIRVHRG
jgi:hypothetical protein